MNIALIENEAVIALEMDMHLEASGHRVVGIAGDRDGCMALLAAEAVDLIIMDIHLDNGDSGLDAAAEALERYDVRSIIVSGSIDVSLGRRMDALKLIAILPKPTAMDELDEALARYEASSERRVA